MFATTKLLPHAVLRLYLLHAATELSTLMSNVMIEIEPQATVALLPAKPSQDTLVPKLLRSVPLMLME